MALQGYKTTHQIADHLNLATGDTVNGHLLSIAITWAKTCIHFICKQGWFLQRESHMYKFLSDE